MTRARHAARGQALPFIALVLVSITAVAGLAVDAGYYRYEQRIEQSAADSAATAGAGEIWYSAASAVAAAKNDAASNGFTDGSGGVTVTVNTGYSSAFTGGSSAVQVQITKTLPKFFEGVLGGGTVPVHATAVGRMSANNINCFYQLKTSGNPNFNGMNFNGPNCGIIMNGTANFNGASINAASILYSGGTPNENGTTFVKATPHPSLAALDPCPHIYGCNYLTNNPPSTSGCIPFNGNGYHGFLNPGCYSSMNLNGAVVTLNPGTYVMTGLMNWNGANVTGNGVTIYIANGGSMNLNGATLALSPPSTGNAANVLFYETTSNTSAPNFNGAASVRISGVVYFPAANVNYNGSLNSYTVLVVGDVNFNGSHQNFPDPPANATFVQEATLSE